jgi:hypothetical protein
MSAVITSSPTRAVARWGRDTADLADLADRGHQPKRSRRWNLVEALAYAGASVDPTAALAARRFARIRDEELGRGRW